MNTIDLSKCEFKTVILEYGTLFGSSVIHGLCNFMFCYRNHDCWVVDVVATCKGGLAWTMTKKCEMKLILQACYNFSQWVGSWVFILISKVLNSRINNSKKLTPLLLQSLFGTISPFAYLDFFLLLVHNR